MAEAAQAPLAGLTVIDLSTTVTGVQASQFLAEAGADVIAVEQPGGTPVRRLAGWPAFGGGKRSIVLDLHDDADRDVLDGLLRKADVVITTSRPKVAARLGLDPERLSRLNPRLVSASVTGWGESGPWSDLKGYEGMVMARLGMFHAKERAIGRRGPAFVSVPYASWGAAHTAVHGVLAALLERETSGLGQHVQTDLVRGVSMLDTWGWFSELVGLRWPGAYESVDAYSDEGEPRSFFVYALLVVPTKDGHWLQFAQNEPRLFHALIDELGLTPMLAEPKWKGWPRLESQELRTELWEIMIERAHSRTLAEWESVFATNPDISAEVFRSGSEVFDHPQLQHDRRVVEIDDPERGVVRRPSTLVHTDHGPLTPVRPAPRLNQHGEQLRDWALKDAAAVQISDEAQSAPRRLPLEGVTVLEFAVMFAAPFGATILTDLGARVIKVECLAGDSIRNVLPFPESGGARVMQGKSSICVDMRTDEGRQIATELARRSDVVLQGFRAGVATRMGVDSQTMSAINPNLVYVNAPGYGTAGPFGGRPAYAPSIAAATGMALAEAPDAAQETGSVAQIRQASIRLNTAGAVPQMQADGLSAVAVASTMLLGLLTRARGRATGPLTVTMLATGTHVVADRLVEYASRPVMVDVDAGGYGLGPLYRMYQAADGWVFLAAPTAPEWDGFVEALAAEGATDLREDARFSSEHLRVTQAAALIAELSAVFAHRRAAEWERVLTARDVGCVAVAEQLPGRLLQADPALAAEYATSAEHPIFDEHLRFGPAVRFSRSRTQSPGGCTAGQHTRVLLTELGYDAARIDELHAKGVVAS